MTIVVKGNKLALSVSLFLIAGIVITCGISSAKAVTETVVSKSIQLERERVSFTDVKNASTVSDPEGVCNGLAKRVVIDTVPAGGEVNSIVTMAHQAFAGTNVDQIGVVAVRAEQGGVQLSNGDIATPDSDLMDTSYIENRQANSSEIAFYDESASWDVAAYICGRDVNTDPVSLNNLTQGSVDFYVSVTKF